MTTFAADPAETRVMFWRTDETAVIGEGTRQLSPPALRRPFAGTGHHNTGEQPLWPTGAELAVGFQEPPVGTPPPLPPTPAPPNPSWNGPAGHYPPIPGSPPGPPPTPEPSPVPPPVAEPVTELLTIDVRPKNYHPRHRECRCLPVTTIVVAGVCTGALTNGALLAVAWVMAQ